MTYSHNEFYKASFTDKPTVADAQQRREKSVRLLTTCVAAVKLVCGGQEIEKQVRGSLMKALNDVIKLGTTSQWANENVPSNSPILLEAQKLIDAYYPAPSTRTSRTTRSPQQRKEPKQKRKINPPRIRPPKALPPQGVILSHGKPVKVKIKKPSSE